MISMLQNKFSEKTNIYINEVLKDGDHVRACTVAGYKSPKNSAVQNKRNPRVQAEIRRRGGLDVDFEIKKTGGPSKLTDDIVNKICEAIKLGMTYEDASVFAGVTRRTFQNWLKEGRAGNEKYREFLEKIENAEVTGMAVNLSNIHKASQAGSWQAGAWLLERRHPEKFGRNIEVRAKVEHDENVIDLSSIPDGDLKIIEGILKKHQKKIIE